MKRRRSHDEDNKQRLLTKSVAAEGRARQHIEEIIDKAKSHNQAISQRVSRKLLFEASHRESLARKLTSDMEKAEQRRTKRVEMIVQRNVQRTSAAAVVGRAAKARAAMASVAVASATQASGAASPASRTGQETNTHRSMCTELLSQINARLHPVSEASVDADGGGQTFETLTMWLRTPETIELVSRCLAVLGASPPPTQRQNGARIVLALLCMAIDAKRMFDPKAKADRTMRREASRFASKFTAALRRTTGGASEEFDDEDDEKLEPFRESLRRASRFYTAWSAQDRPQTLEQLMAAVVAESARQRERGLEQPDPPEALFAQVQGVGGAVAEAEARSCFARAWERVATAQQLEQAVRTIAERAFWDSLSQRVSDGDFDALFSLLGEIQQAMRALVAHSPRAVAELADKFDPEWLKQRADHGALDVPSVIGLMRYVARTITEWQAPADDNEAREWLASTEAWLCANEGSDDLHAFISAHLVPFLRGAIERLGRVYQRTVEFMEEHEAGSRPAREPAASDDTNLGQQD